MCAWEINCYAVYCNYLRGVKQLLYNLIAVNLVNN